jgi:hypothetical protein
MKEKINQEFAEPYSLDPSTGEAEREADAFYFEHEKHKTDPIETEIKLFVYPKNIESIIPIRNLSYDERKNLYQQSERPH